MRPSAVILVIACASILALAIGWWIGSLPTFHTDADELQAEGLPSEAGGDGTGKQHEPSGITPEFRVQNDDEYSLRSEDFALFGTQLDLEQTLAQIESENQWVEYQAASNQMKWLQVCRKASSYFPDAQLDQALLSEELQDPRLGIAHKLRKYCHDFVKENELEIEDYFLKVMQGYLEGDGVEAYSQDLRARVEEVRELVESKEVDAARKILIEALQSALNRLDEIAIDHYLGPFAVHDGLLHPPSFSREANLNDLYPMVIGEVTLALMCDEIGGCFGMDHPFVLRQCVSRIEYGAICIEPLSIHEAIHQTLTPIQHQIFSDMYSQVRDYLISWRRSKN